MTPGTFDRACAALLAEGQPVRFRASGLSMEPAIRDGDLLTVEPLGPRPPRRGDVVLYRAGTRLLAHRVRSVDPESGLLVCQGDLFSCDEETVAASSLLGSVVAVGDPGRPPAPRRESVRWLGRLRAAASRLARAAGALPVANEVPRP